MARTRPLYRIVIAAALAGLAFIGASAACPRRSPDPSTEDAHASRRTSPRPARAGSGVSELDGAAASDAGERDSDEPPHAEQDHPPVGSVSFRRLDDGTALGGVVVELEDRDGHIHRVEADASGTARVPDGAIPPFIRLAICGSGWSVSPQAASCASKGRDVWCFETIRVEGTVRCEDPDFTPALDTANALWRFIGVPGQRGGAPSSHNEFLAELTGKRTGIARGAAVPLDSARKFSMDAPRAPGVFATVQTRGMTVGSAPVDPAGADTQFVEIVVPAMVRVRGIVRDAAGNSIPAATIVAYVERRSPVPVPPTAEDRLRGISTVWISRPSGTVLVQSVQITSDATGAYELTLPFRAIARVQCYVPGCAISETDFDATLSDSNNIVATLDSATRVRLEWNGTPIAGGSWWVADLSRDGAQPCCPIQEVPESGAIPTGWLVRGRKYSLKVEMPAPQRGRRVGGLFVWDGQDVIEVSKLKVTALADR